MNPVRSAHWTAVAVAVALVAVAVGASAFAPLNEPLSAAEHGELVARTGTTVTPFQFVGAAGVRSEGGTLYRMGARFYDAGLRRFLSPDPLGIDGGFNLYAYADADPVNWIDPLGLCAQSGWGAPSVDANGFGTRSLSPTELSRVMSRMGLREELHPLAVQTAIDTAFKAVGTVALLAVPGPEDLIGGAVLAGMSRVAGGMRFGAVAARTASAVSAGPLPSVLTRRSGARFFHSAPPTAVTPILTSGFRTDLPNVMAAGRNNRFMRGVYLADSPVAALAERPGGVVLGVDAALGRNLDIRYLGPVYDIQVSRAIARGARKHGFDSITTMSVRTGGGVNTVLFDPARARAIGVFGSGN